VQFLHKAASLLQLGLQVIDVCVMLTEFCVAAFQELQIVLEILLQL